MNDQLTIDAYKVPVLYRPDVCIVGAGAAGVAAAIGASRLGLSTLLIEKYGFSGGATVAGLSGTICGLFSNGKKPEQIVFGFADEFYQALKKRNGVTDPVPFGKTLLVPHDSLKWKETADQLLTGHHCKVIYHSYFLKALTNEAGAIGYLLIKGPGGEFAVKPKYVIDASGDAEVVHSLHGGTFLGNKGVVQTPTMIFKMANVGASALRHLDPVEMESRIAEANRSGKYRLPRQHVYLFPLPNKGEVLCNMTKITYPDGRTPLGIDTEDLTFAEIEGRRQAREYSRFLIENIPGFQDAYLSDTGAQVGIRQTRSIIGEGILKNEDVLQARKTIHAITHSAWPIELHDPGKLKIVFLEDNTYDIPFETLIPKSSVNLLVAGRCISAEHEALASARVTAQCFGMGYAAGAACSLMLHEKIKACRVAGEEVTTWMKQHKLKTAHEQ